MPYCRNCGSQLQETDNFCESCGTARRAATPKVNYAGKTCPFCQFPLKADSDVTICSACGIPHHRDCWSENGGCTTFGCSSLTGEHENQSGAMEPTTIIDVEQVSGEILEDSFHESLVRQVAELARSARDTTIDNSQRVKGESIYQLTYQTGELSLQDLPIGTRIFDPTWVWEFRTGYNYSGSGNKKPVVWIVVAKNHYEGLEPHVTLLSEELISIYAFDNSTRFIGLISGNNFWGDSTNANFTRNLRFWLNSADFHSGEGFYRAFSNNFKQAVLTTTVLNKEWKNGRIYSTRDHVFIPSTTELGDIVHSMTYRIGSVYSYFTCIEQSNRVACLGDDARWYWTRSPGLDYGDIVHGVSSAGAFGNLYACGGDYGVRPALNLKSGILVSEINTFEID